MTLPTNRCLLKHAHGPHEWWYTSYGGGHMLSGPDPTEKNVRQFHCEGLTLHEEPIHTPPTDPMWSIRHAWAASTPGDYTQNAADFDRKLAEHDKKLQGDSAADVWDRAVYHMEAIIGSEMRRRAMLDNPYR